VPDVGDDVEGVAENELVAAVVRLGDDVHAGDAEPGALVALGGAADVATQVEQSRAGIERVRCGQRVCPFSCGGRRGERHPPGSLL
jgi:hypothetical protein